MFRRSIIFTMLVCYGATALVGQGLHNCIHADASNRHGDCAGPSQLFASADELDHHDNAHCSICQHQSLGQLYVVESQVDSASQLREFYRCRAPVRIRCLVQFSPAMPRAPPMI